MPNWEGFYRARMKIILEDSDPTLPGAVQQQCLSPPSPHGCAGTVIENCAEATTIEDIADEAPEFGQGIAEGLRWKLKCPVVASALREVSSKVRATHTHPPSVMVLTYACLVTGALL